MTAARDFIENSLLPFTKVTDTATSIFIEQNRHKWDKSSKQGVIDEGAFIEAMSEYDVHSLSHDFQRKLIQAYESAKATIRESRKVEPVVKKPFTTEQLPPLPNEIPEDCQNFNTGWYINSLIDCVAALYEGRK